MADIVTRAKTFSNTVTFNGAVTANAALSATAGLTVSGGAAISNTFVDNNNNPPSSGFTTNLALNAPNANRIVINYTLHVFYSNANGTPVSPRFTITILDGASTIVSRTHTQGVSSGFSNMLTYSGSFLVTKPVASDFTVRFQDTQLDGGSHGFGPTYYTANAYPQQLG